MQKGTSTLISWVVCVCGLLVGALLLYFYLLPSRHTVVTLTSGSPAISPTQTHTQSSTIKPLEDEPNTESPDTTPRVEMYGRSEHPNDASIVWTNARTALFEVTDSSDNVSRGIYSNFEAPYALQIDDFFGYSIVYLQGDELRRRQVDKQLGTDTETLLTQLAITNAHGLGYDQQSGRLYIGDEFGRAAYSLNWPTDNNAAITKLLISDEEKL